MWMSNRGFIGMAIIVDGLMLSLKSESWCGSVFITDVVSSNKQIMTTSNMVHVQMRYIRAATEWVQVGYDKILEYILNEYNRWIPNEWYKIVDDKTIGEVCKFMDELW